MAAVITVYLMLIVEFDLRGKTNFTFIFISLNFLSLKAGEQMYGLDQAALFVISDFFCSYSFIYP